MATKKGKPGNGHDRLTVEVVDVLKQVAGTMLRIEKRLDQLTQDVSTIRQDLAGFKDETRGELTAIHAELKGDHAGTVNARLTRLEEAVFKKTG